MSFYVTLCLPCQARLKTIHITNAFFTDVTSWCFVCYLCLHNSMGKWKEINHQTYTKWHGWLCPGATTLCFLLYVYFFQETESQFAGQSEPILTKHIACCGFFFLESMVVVFLRGGDYIWNALLELHMVGSTPYSKAKWYLRIWNGIQFCYYFLYQYLGSSAVKKHHIIRARHCICCS